MATRRFACAIVLVTLGAAAPARGHAQSDHDFASSDSGYYTPGWAGELATLSVNALLGGVIAGIGRELRGGAFRDAFTSGTLGGTVVYAGKRIAVGRWDGAGLVGRQTAAVGASITRNSIEARPVPSELMLPIGPVRLYLTTTRGLRIRPRLDVAAAITLASALAEPRLELDVGASLSAGTPVFDAGRYHLRSGGGDAAGLELFGVVLIASESRGMRALVLAHERVHVLQHDVLFHTVSDPIEDWILGRVPRISVVSRYLDFGAVDAFLLDGLARLGRIEHDDRPWEFEADFLATR